LKWLGIFDETFIPLRSATSAQILQHLLQQKWKLQKGELDMIVMQHQFQYTQDEKQYHKSSSLLVKGENEVHTAMAKTVGLPMGIAAKLVLQGKLNLKGVQIPIMPELYLPVLNELENLGVKFIEI
jgi:saccharopine dehydrogenase-like NADP-dependent oxidoreductase